MSVDVTNWTALVGKGRDSVDAWARLLQRWSEPHRRYHGVRHLGAVLLFVEEFAAHATDPDAVRLAAWYHDAIYDPRATDNEECSAVLAENELAALGVPGDRVAESARLVRLTADHEPAEGDRNGELLNDADLLVLASPPEAYVAYVNAVREEYAHVSDSDFRAGRTAVLESLMKTPRLFRLDQLSSLEPAARHNINAELSLLSATDAAGGDAVPPAAEPPAPPAR